MKHMHRLTGKECNSNGFEGQFKVTTYALSLWEIHTIAKVSGSRSFLSQVYSLFLSVQQYTILETKSHLLQHNIICCQTIKFSKILQISVSTNLCVIESKGS